jgi:transcriptional regulator with XRE-family HTH domain
MSTISEQMGQRLRELREERQYTQRYLAGVLCTSQQLYSRYESGKSTLPVIHLVTLADLYGVTTDYILGRTRLRNFVPGAEEYADGISCRDAYVTAMSLRPHDREKVLAIIRYVLAAERQEGTQQKTDKKQG